LRYDPETTGQIWLVGEMYDPYKMCHSHEVKPMSPTEIKAPAVPVFEEEHIDSDNDSYGNENMEFADADPVGDLPPANDRIELVGGQNESPISEEFSQKDKFV